jgi:hypothetical protein
MPLRTWNGSTFATAKSARVWDGSSFVPAKSAKVWNGSSWVNFLSSVNITEQTVSATGGGFDQAGATVKYSLLSDGTARTLEIADFVYNDDAIPGEWLVGGVAADFSVRATASVFNMGPDGFFSGTLDTWESLSSTREWEVSVNTQNSQAEAVAYLLIEIAYTADLTTVISSAIIYLIADAFTAQ